LFTELLIERPDEVAEGFHIKARFRNRHTKTKLNERQNLMLNKLLDGFEGKLTAKKWAKITKCSHDTALRDIHDLIDKEILAKEYPGGRSSSYRLLE